MPNDNEPVVQQQEEQQPEVAEAEESFRQYVDRRNDELSGRSAERDKQAQAIADAVLSRLPQPETAEATAVEQPQPRDEGGRFTAQPSAPPLLELVSGHGIAPEAVTAYLEKGAAQLVELQKREDFADLMATADAVPVMDHVAAQVVELGNPEIAWHLVQDPGLVLRLNNMPAVKVAAELARISASLDEPVRTSRAPRPPSPVTRATGAAKTLSDDMPYKDWVRIRDAQVAGRRG